MEQAASKSKITRVLADGAYDSKNNFSCLYHKGIIPVLHGERILQARGCYPGKISIISQLTNYNYWNDSVGYGYLLDYGIRVPVIQENVWRTCYGSTKNMIKELELRISL